MHWLIVWHNMKNLYKKTVSDINTFITTAVELQVAGWVSKSESRTIAECGLYTVIPIKWYAGLISEDTWR